MVASLPGSGSGAPFFRTPLTQFIVVPNFAETTGSARSRDPTVKK
jgi:hypothetical protein